MFPNCKLTVNLIGRGLLRQPNEDLTVSLLAILDSTSLIFIEKPVQYVSGLLSAAATGFCSSNAEDMGSVELATE